jgi:hypothetical protein
MRPNTTKSLVSATPINRPLVKHQMTFQNSGQARANDLPTLRCEPDPFHPGLAVCTAEVNDDRQGISHFFGRNKKATASIPQQCFPLMCRVHYQEKGYRWGKHHPGVLADFQCGCIVKTLQNMAAITFTDKNGNVWPWFCGLVLQIPMPKSRKPVKVRARKNVTSQDHRAPGSRVDWEEEDDECVSNTASIPEWLRKLATKARSDDRYALDDNYISNGVKYDIIQVISIVRTMGKWCLENNAKLPKVEAIPVTLGMYFDQALDKAKKDVKSLTIHKDRAASDLCSASTSSARRDAEVVLKLAEDGLLIAKKNLSLARLDLEETAHMIPATRTTRKHGQTSRTIKPKPHVKSELLDRKGKGKAVSPESKDDIMSLDADDEGDKLGIENTEIFDEPEEDDTPHHIKDNVQLTGVQVVTPNLSSNAINYSMPSSSKLASTYFFGRKRDSSAVNDQHSGNPGKRIKRFSSHDCMTF